MGRYAQATRRGRAVSSGPALPLPPAPELEVLDGYLWQFASGNDDTGGFFVVKRSDDPGGPYFEEDRVAWTAQRNWGPVDLFSEGYWIGTEVGNGTSYAGESLASPEVYLAI